MKRTSNSLAFERTWKSARSKDSLIPDRESISPRAFKEFLPMLVFAEMDLQQHTVLVKLAGTGIRDLVGFEITGLDFNTLSTDPYSERSKKRRAGYHDFPFGRCEELSMNISEEVSISCELTMFPVWGPEKSRYLVGLVAPQQTMPNIEESTRGYLTQPFTDEVFLDIGAGIPSSGY